MSRFLRNPSALVGLVIVLLLVVPALCAPLLPIADPNEANLTNRLAPPGSDGHLLGTDSLGRDILSRLLHGLRLSLAVAISATVVAGFAGSLIGLLAGFYRRWVDTLLMRSMDMLLAFPYLILALAIVAVLGPGLLNALLAIAVVNIPFFARNVRGATLLWTRSAFVEAAVLSGRKRPAILLAEVLPNVVPTIIIALSTTLGWMILETAGLSFLGLGAQPPTADLGAMLAEGRTVMLVHPHVGLLPGVVILILVVGLNLMGDALRDVLDPRLSQGVSAAPGAATVVERGGARAAGAENAGPVEDSFVDVRNLTLSFSAEAEGAPAVQDVSFRLGRAEALGIVGESGSGKSVTALALSRLVPSPPARILRGEVRIGDTDVLRASPSALRQLRGRRVSYIFQNPWDSLHPMIRVGEQVMESLRLHGPVSRAAARRRARELFEQVALPDAEAALRAYPHQLSGGQCQRVGIAMALANQPELLIADEPTTALDVTVQKQVLDLLRQIREEHGLALIFISHDLGVVQAVVDRVMVMRRGMVVEEGPTAAVLSNPRHAYTQQLMAASPVLGRGRKQDLGEAPADARGGEGA
ncbi:MAG: dipeptide/oligopeptide/nickel ABC transporter permease/ATP-binding protein [Opitutales bacterium]|nr:dipeptide/oligopeptide/nickel ABC transporter permease/ATP-binding protein [Opitutales bacterium]